MKKFAIALLGAPLLASAQSDAVNTAEYFPFRVGDVWSYENTFANQYYTKVCQFDTKTIASGAEPVLKDMPGVCSNNSDYSGVTYYFLRSGEGTFLTRLVGVDTDDSFSPYYLFLPSSLTPGQSFSSSGRCGANDCTYTSTGKMLSHSNVRTDLGVLDSIQIEFKIRQTWKVDGGHIVMYDITDTYWMAHGVGTVKRHTDTNPYVDGMPSVTSTAELVLRSFTGDVNKKDDGEDEDCSKFCGHPIDLTSGNLFEAQEDIPSFGGNIPFARYYNSRSSAMLPLGQGWTHSYIDRVRYIEETEEAMFERADGKTLVFSRPINGGPWKGNEDLGLRLVALYSDLQTDRNPIGWYLSSVAGKLGKV